MQRVSDFPAEAGRQRQEQPGNQSPPPRPAGTSQLSGQNLVNRLSPLFHVRPGSGGL